MARANPDRDKAFEIYKEHKGDIDLVKIAEMLDRPPGTIRGWKNKDNWEERLNGTFQNITERSNQKGTLQTKVEQANKEPIAKEVKQVMENPELNDKQRLFCLYYSKTFNATRSYQKAYGCSYETAWKNASTLMANQGIRDEIMRLKEQRYAQALLRPEDIFQKYMDIAFADITDYVTFKQEERQAIGIYGPLTFKDENGEKVPVMETVNTVMFKDSLEIDGTIISDVSLGRNGEAVVKLADRMKALQWLADHMDMATEEQRLKCEKLRADIAKVKDPSGEKPIEVIIKRKGDG